MKKQGLLAASLVALCLTTAAPTAFADQAPSTGVSVRTADLDLSQPRDAAILLDRLDRAADRSCTGEFGIRRGAAFDACKADALDQAVRQISAPEVTRLYQQSAEAQSARMSVAALN